MVANDPLQALCQIFLNHRNFSILCFKNNLMDHVGFKQFECRYAKKRRSG